MERYRAETFWTKEPETIAWLESFTNGDTFFDVGANIGIYALYAGSLYLDSEIRAFEPHHNNFLRLAENIALNQYTNVMPALLAFSDVKKKEMFYAPSAEIGSSGGQISNPVSEYGKNFEAVYQRMVFTISMSEYCALHRLEPNHIKIDVDGQEWRIIKGMEDILKDDYLETILVEVNNDKKDIVNYLYDFGFSTYCIFNKLKNHSRIRRAKEGIKAENIVFVRR